MGDISLLALVTHLVVPSDVGEKVCPALSARTEPPRGAHDLRPDDIGLVLALGDSMTAGFALKGGLAEYRGQSFSAGGDPGAVTMPNFLRSLGGNGKVTGYSLGVRQGIHTTDLGCQGDDINLCQLNAAVDGANMIRMLSQVEYLSKMIYGNCGDGMICKDSNSAVSPNVLRGRRLSEFYPAPFRNHSKDWKLVTMFAGLADVVFVNGTASHVEPTPFEVFRMNFQSVLQAIRTKLGGRIFLNVMALPQQLALVETIIKSNLECRLVDILSHLPESPIHWSDPSHWDETAQRYNEIIREEVAKVTAEQDPHFFVSIQPFMQDLTLRGSMVDHFDCFHPNGVLAQNMSVALWNSMIGSGPKSTTIGFTAEPLCPTETTRLH